MKTPELYSFTRYLEAKRTVDDRALNQHVWHALKETLSTFQRPIHLLEVGGGVGTMLTRFIEHEFFNDAEYTIIDQDPENIQRAFTYLRTWAEKHAFEYTALTETTLLLVHGEQRIRVHVLNEEVYAFLAQSTQKWDVLVAHAVLDLLDLQKALPVLFEKLAPDGIFYFSINYDGLTIFEPASEPGFEQEILQLYHRSMDERVIDGVLSGDSESGRHLFTNLTAHGAMVMAAGSSDWVVFPQENKYVADEAYFLHHLLSFFENSLSLSPDLDQEKFHAWLKQRHQQIEAGALIYIAHQLDVLGKVS